MLNKNAVSPLIATVLLVMIVVSIGAAVMVVIQGLTEEQIERIRPYFPACRGEPRRTVAPFRMRTLATIM